jgi:hypothetical protein
LPLAPNVDGCTDPLSLESVLLFDLMEAYR